MAKAGLLDHFSALKDPRQAWKVVYPLQEVLLIVLCGTMAGAEDFADIERWARAEIGLTESGRTLYLLVFASSFSAKWHPLGGMMR